MVTCKICKQSKTLNDFYVSNRVTCKCCVIERNKRYYRANLEQKRAYQLEYQRLNPGKISAKVARRRATKQSATPPWANLDCIRSLYEYAREKTQLTGFVHNVDHIHPLNGKDICGLHVLANLQVIPSYINTAKSNRFNAQVTTDWPSCPIRWSEYF